MKKPEGTLLKAIFKDGLLTLEIEMDNKTAAQWEHLTYQAHMAGGLRPPIAILGVRVAPKPKPLKISGRH